MNGEKICRLSHVNQPELDLKAEIHVHALSKETWHLNLKHTTVFGLSHLNGHNVCFSFFFQRKCMKERQTYMCV